MASDGTRVFVIGGELSPGAHVHEAKFIYVLGTELLIYPKPDSNTDNHSEKTTQLAQELSTGHPSQGPQHRMFSPSEAGAAHGAFPFQIATSEDMGRSASPQITRELNTSPNLPSQPTWVDDKPRCIPREDDDSESSTEHLAKLVAPNTSEKEVVRLEQERFVELERELLAMRAAQTERDRRIAQLTKELVQNNALLEQAEANAAEAKKRAGLEQRVLLAKLDELLLWGNHALEHAQSALQKATSRAAEADERSQRELAEVRAELEARECELVVVRLRLMDAEDSCAKSKAEADTLHAGTQAAAGLVSMDVDRVMSEFMERVRAVEAEIASLRRNEKA